MAVSQIDITQISGGKLFIDTVNADTVIDIKGSSAVIYSLELDNSLNGADTYVKFWNVASGSVVLGTTAPELSILVPANATLNLIFVTGVTYGTALSVAAVTTAGTAGSVAPAANFALKVVYV